MSAAGATLPAPSIRRATSADHDAVVALQVDSQNEEAALHPSRASGEEVRGVAWEMIHLRQGLMFVAEAEGTLVGHVGGAHVLDSSPFFKPEWRHYGLIFDLYVRPEFRRRGLAKQLVHAISDALLESGAHRLRIVGLANNDAALALYRGLGFSDYEVTLEKTRA